MRPLTFVIACVCACGVTSPASAGRLQDGTVVPVRMVGIINSETSNAGQPLVFVVTDDVVIDGAVAIKRGTAVAGEVTRVRRAKWGFTDKKPILEFTFRLTTASNGQVIPLRASAGRGSQATVVVDRGRRHHQIRWAGDADMFRAYVDGTYEF
jgi:hypothetical protein